MLIYHLIASYTWVFRFFNKKGLLIHLLVVAPQDLLYLTASIDSVTYSHAMRPPFIEASSSVTGSVCIPYNQTTAMHSYVATYQS